MVAEFRESDERTPVVLMGYANSLLRADPAGFAARDASRKPPNAFCATCCSNVSLARTAASERLRASLEALRRRAPRQRAQGRLEQKPGLPADVSGLSSLRIANEIGHNSSAHHSGAQQGSLTREENFEKAV